jgi:hypothetical protein
MLLAGYFWIPHLTLLLLRLHADHHDGWLTLLLVPSIVRLPRAAAVAVLRCLNGEILICTFQLHVRSSSIGMHVHTPRWVRCCSIAGHLTPLLAVDVNSLLGLL